MTSLGCIDDGCIRRVVPTRRCNRLALRHGRVIPVGMERCHCNEEDAIAPGHRCNGNATTPVSTECRACDDMRWRVSIRCERMPTYGILSRASHRLGPRAQQRKPAVLLLAAGSRTLRRAEVGVRLRRIARSRAALRRHTTEHHHDRGRRPQHRHPRATPAGQPPGRDSALRGAALIAQ